jgi:hypothetical protein
MAHAHGTFSTSGLALAWGTELHGKAECLRHAATINILPDDVFLEIFSFCLHDPFMEFFEHTVEWQGLVQVCRRWRQIIYESPRYLDLLLYCSEGLGTPVKNLSCWPAFPIAMGHRYPRDENDVIALLKHSDRVRFISLSLMRPQSGKVVAAMQEPFPVLTHLELCATGNIGVPDELPVVLPVPGGFLGGSAPCLRLVKLAGIPFPELPTHLLSFRDLVFLHVDKIPPNGYISPDAMVAGLAVLTKLQTLRITFRFWRPFPEQRTGHPDPPMRVILPALTSFSFGGECSYLEDLVAQIDTPQLDSIDITYYDLEDSLVPQLSEFIANRSDLKPSRFRDAEIFFDNSKMISFCFRHGTDPDESISAMHIISKERPGIDEQVWDMAQLLSQTSTMLSDVVRLEINAGPWQLKDHNMDDVEWLELLLPFTAVETLCISEECAASVAHAFDVGLAPQVLPALGLLFLEGQPARTIKELFTIFRACGRLTIISKEGCNSEGSDSEIDPQAMPRVLEYLKGTADFALAYGLEGGVRMPEGRPVGFTDTPYH